MAHVTDISVNCKDVGNSNSFFKYWSERKQILRDFLLMFHLAKEEMMTGILYRFICKTEAAEGKLRL